MLPPLPAFAWSEGGHRSAIPEKSIAQKKELLFSDDFEGTEPAKLWHKVVPTFVVENGVIKGTQTRDKDIEATGGKPAIKAHAAVHGGGCAGVRLDLRFSWV